MPHGGVTMVGYKLVETVTPRNVIDCLASLKTEAVQLVLWFGS